MNSKSLAYTSQSWYIRPEILAAYAHPADNYHAVDTVNVNFRVSSENETKDFTFSLTVDQANELMNEVFSKLTEINEVKRMADAAQRNAQVELEMMPHEANNYCPF